MKTKEVILYGIILALVINLVANIVWRYLPQYAVIGITSVLVVSCVIIARLTQAPSEIDTLQSHEYNEKGREKIRQFVQTGNWHDLVHAIEYYLESIKYDRTYEHAWINLAYAHHLVGNNQQARECLRKADTLAEPGDHYNSVEKAVRNDSDLQENKLNRSILPDEIHQRIDQFTRKYQELL